MQTIDKNELVKSWKSRADMLDIKRWETTRDQYIESILRDVEIIAVKDEKGRFIVQRNPHPTLGEEASASQSGLD